MFSNTWKIEINNIDLKNSCFWQVLEDSSPNKVVFKSRFFGSFVCGITVVPNKIDFDFVLTNFTEAVSKSWLVLSVICSLIPIFIMLLFVARKRDKEDSYLVSSFSSYKHGISGIAVENILKFEIIL